jgi:hypothetical protein
MLETIKNIFKKRKGAFFNSTDYELNNFFCGFGKCKIENDKITISDYKFKPSKAYPKITLSKEQITSITIDSNPPQINYENEWIFVSAEHKDELEEFISRNNIPKSEKNWDWDGILDPFLDTEFTTEDQENTLKKLEENGIKRDETLKIREKVSKQMYKYNFDTMLWDWCSLGLSDVLQAMRVKLTDEEFKDFYNYAMKIENKNATQ